jgi:hypothetical protein
MTRTPREAGLIAVPGRLSVAVIATLVIELSAVIWFLAQLEGRVGVNEQFRVANAQLQAQFIRLDERFDAVLRDLDRIELRLMRLEEHFTSARDGDRSR